MKLNKHLIALLAAGLSLATPAAADAPPRALEAAAPESGTQLLTAADGSTDPATATIEFAFAPRTNPQAVVVVGLFDSESSFDAREPIRSARLQPGDSLWRIAGLAPGHYALLAFEDLDGDGELDLDDRGLPLEPFTVSGRRALRVPRFDRAKVELDASLQRHDLQPWRQFRKRRR